MKKKKQMKIILAIVVVIAILLGGWVMMQPGRLSAEESNPSEGAIGEKTGIGVTIEAPDKIQTYTVPDTGTKPGKVPLTLNIIFSKEVAEGTQMIIPFKGFIPAGQTAAGDAYEYFDMKEDILELSQESLEKIRGKSYIKTAEITGNGLGKQLVLTFAKTAPRAFKLVTYFDFNSAYDGKIPSEHCVWKDAQAFVYSQDEPSQPDAISNSVTIKTNAKFTFTNWTIKTSPMNMNYGKGNISLHLNLQNMNVYKSKLREGTGFKVYVEIPKQFTLTWSNNPTAPPWEYIGEKDGYKQYSCLKTVSENTPSINLMGLMVLTPSSEIDQLPDEFHINMKLQYKQKNGAIVTQEISNFLNPKEGFQYIYQKGSFFSMYVPSSLIRRYEGIDGHDVYVNQELGKISDKVTFSRPGFNENTVMNEGTKEVKDVVVSLEQNQTDTNNPATIPKVNFNTFQNLSAKIPVRFRCYFADGVTGQQVGNAQVSDRIAINGVWTVPFPPARQYISKVEMVPAADGYAEGVLPPGENIASVFTAKKWPNEKWPNGDDISNAHSYMSLLSGSASYKNEEGEDITQEIKKNFPIYYVSNGVFASTTKLINLAPSGVEIGQKVTYSLQNTLSGYNSIGDWIKPVMYFAVPKIMQIISPENAVLGEGDSLSISSEVNGSLGGNNTTITRMVSNDPQYNYYKVAINGTLTPDSSINDQILSKTDLTFLVDKNALPNSTYPIPVVVATSEDPTKYKQFFPTNWKNLDYISGADEPYLADTLKDTFLSFLDPYNLSYSAFGRVANNEEKDPYRPADTGNPNNPLKVLPAGGLNPNISVKIGPNKWGDPVWQQLFKDWKTSLTGGQEVTTNQFIQIKGGLTNDSETATYKSPSLYYKLPDAGTEDNYTGRPKLVSIDLSLLDEAQKNNTTIYYTTLPLSDLPDYDKVNLGDWFDGASGNEAELSLLGFTPWNDPTETPNLEEGKTITGIFITGTDELATDSSFEPILNFEIPAATQKPFLPESLIDFKYSIKTLDGSEELQNRYIPIQINTQTLINLTYDENLPTGATGEPTGIPTNPDPFAVDNETGKSREDYIIPTPAPTLLNYTFTGWQLKIDGKVVTEGEENPVAVVYQPGDQLDLDAAKGLNWTLVAQWEPQYAIEVSAEDLIFKKTEVPLSSSNEKIPRTLPSDFTIKTIAPTESKYNIEVSLLEDFTSKTADAKELSLSDILTFQKGATNTNGTTGSVPLKGVAPTTKSLTIFKGEGTKALKLGDPDIGDFVLDLDYVQAMPVASFLKATNQQSGAEFKATIEFALTTTP